MSKAYIPVALRRALLAEANHRCGYCLSSEQFIYGKLVPDHLIPEAKGGQTVRENLWMACRLCNEHKHARTHAVDPTTGKLTPLFNPRFQIWRLHFAWSPSGTHLIGLTAIGRATVDALNMNSHTVVETRKNWVAVGWHPPDF